MEKRLLLGVAGTVATVTGGMFVDSAVARAEESLSFDVTQMASREIGASDYFAACVIKEKCNCTDTNAFKKCNPF